MSGARRGLLTNFLRMPGLLKWLTLVATGAALAAARLEWHAPWTASSAHGPWWSAGAAVAVALAAVSLGGSIVLLLKRSRHARAAFIASWATTWISSALVVYAVGNGLMDALAQASFGAACTVVVAAYVFRSRAVAEYFDSESGPGGPPLP